jgi:hypothetical protein
MSTESDKIFDRLRLQVAGTNKPPARVRRRKQAQQEATPTSKESKRAGEASMDTGIDAVLKYIPSA